MAFYAITTLMWIVAFPALLIQGDVAWAAVITIFYIEFWDSLRHNRQ